MARYVSEEIEAYAERYTTAGWDGFDRLADETRATQSAPQMMVGDVEGAFLSFLVTMTKARRVVEVGTFTGWSSIAMARALPPDGSIVTCDVNEETSAVARRYAEEAGVADRIEYRLGPAVETLATLEGPFDLAFIDADKGGYVDYYEAILPKLAPGGADRRRQHALRPRLRRRQRPLRSAVSTSTCCTTIAWKPSSCPFREGVTLIRRR